MTSTLIRDVELTSEWVGRPTGATVEPLVWGHGLTSSMASEDAFGLLRWPEIGAHRPVLRYDARGHGTSGSTADPHGYHWRELAHDQLALADALDIDRYVAGGASMGCATALHAAAIAPERVTALLLVIPPTAWETRAAQQEGYELTAQLVEADKFDVLIAGAAASPPPDPLIGVPEWSDRFANVLRDTEPGRLARIFRGAAVTDLPTPDEVASICVPTLVLAWTGDAGHPMSTAERLVELIPGSRLVPASTLDELHDWTPTAIEFLAGL